MAPNPTLSLFISFNSLPQLLITSNPRQDFASPNKRLVVSGPIHMLYWLMLAKCIWKKGIMQQSTSTEVRRI